MNDHLNKLGSAIYAAGAYMNPFATQDGQATSSEPLESCLFFGRTITISSPNLCFGIRKFGNTATGTVMKPFRFVSKLLQKTIISDDFSPPTWLGQLLGDTYTSRMQKATAANNYPKSGFRNRQAGVKSWSQADF